MRFDKETRAKIQQGGSGSITIRWPARQPAPEKGRTYRVQALEDIEKAEARLEYSPPSQRDVLAQMYKSFYGEWPADYEPPKPELRRPSKADPCILVLDVEILERGWEATVTLWEEADPVRHTGLKTRISGGLDPLSTLAGDPITGQTPTELEPEQIVKAPTRAERQDEEESLRLEHKASAAALDIAKAQKQVDDEIRQGKPGKLAAQALERAKRRARLADAA